MEGDANRRLKLLEVRPLQNANFRPISASVSNFIPQNTQCIHVVKPDLKFDRLP